MQTTLISIPDAVPRDRKSGWRINYKLLERIRDQIATEHYKHTFEVPSLEEIEAILLILLSIKG